MALTQKLELRQSQALVMTPQLMQAIKLLQLSNLDLPAYVEGELQRKPPLEHAPDGEDDAPRNEADASSEPAPSAEASATEWIGEEFETSRGAMEERLGNPLDNIFSVDDTAPAPRAGSDTVPTPSEWATTGSGGRADDDYNL